MSEPRFALGSHAPLNALAIGLINDLVQMGHNVLMMDCDLVWVQDPRAQLSVLQSGEPAATTPSLKLCSVANNFHHHSRRLRMAQDEAFDILALQEGRHFGPPASANKLYKEGNPPEGERVYQLLEETQHGNFDQFNTGFVLVRSTPMAKFFLASVVNALPLVLWQRSDQLIWNNLLFHRRFANVSAGFMPYRNFVSGAHFDSKGSMKGTWRTEVGKTFPRKEEGLVIVHVSDVDSHLRKVTKFNNVGHWYLTGSNCSLERTCSRVNISPGDGCTPKNLQALLDDDGKGKRASDIPVR